MKIFIASDHGGFDLKTEIRDELRAMSYELEDLGPSELNPEDDYPDFALKVATEVSKEGMDENHNHKALGILICRSGNGMVIAANKVKGAYAALAFSKHHARMARVDDNANILCLDSDYEGENPVEIVKAFLEAEFSGIETRHGRRFKKILEMEK